MKPTPPDPAEVLHRVRQQLILAQVRIMELEDVRDETAARLEDHARLLHAAQALADQKLDEAAHAEKNRAELEAQCAHLRHVQRVNNEALEEIRTQLQALQQQLAACLRDAAGSQQRVSQLEAELQALRTSRSWRWTAWLRSLDGKKP